MPIDTYDRNTDTADVLAALSRDGAVIVREQVEPDLARAVLLELRDAFERLGRMDESDFNGYRTRRISRILAVSKTAAKLVAHPRVLEVADAVLLPHCVNYRIGSLTGVEIRPGEVDQRLHTDDAIYPIQLPGVQLQFSAMWALDDFTVANGATRVVLGSHRKVGGKQELAQAVMPRGSVLFYLGTTVHGGGANRTASPRAGLVNTYALGWLRQEENQYLSIPQRLVESFPPAIRELLGYRTHGLLGAYQHPDGRWVRD